MVIPVPAALGAQTQYQVEHDGEVRGDDEQRVGSHVLDQLVHLERQEGRGGDHREVLGPVAPEQEAHPLGEEDRRVDERAEPDRAQRPGIERERGREGPVDPVGPRIQVQARDPAGERLGRVVPGEVQRGHPRGQQASPLTSLNAPMSQSSRSPRVRPQPLSANFWNVWQPAGTRPRLTAKVQVTSPT